MNGKTPRDKRHSVLVLHGLNMHDTTRIRAFFELAKNLLERFKLPITKVGYDGARSMLWYNRARKRVDSALGSAQSVELCSMPEGVEHTLDYCYADMMMTKYRPAVVIGFESDLMPLRSEAWRPIAEECIRRFDPRYGYVYERPFDYGAYLYAVCLGASNVRVHCSDAMIPWRAA